MDFSMEWTVIIWQKQCNKHLLWGLFKMYRGMSQIWQISIQRSQGIYHTTTVTKGSEHILNKTILCVLKPTHFIDHFEVSNFAVVQLLEVGFTIVAMNVFRFFCVIYGDSGWFQCWRYDINRWVLMR